MTYNVSIDSPVRRVQAAAICSALKARVLHNIQVNRAYTPLGMTRTASLFTGKSYKTHRAGMVEAHNDLADLLGKDHIK